MKLPWFRVLVFLACLITATSCNSALKLGNVFVTVTEYHPTAVDGVAQLKLRFSNENVFPLAIAKTQGKLYLNDTYAGMVEVKDAVGVPSLMAVNHDAVLHVENATLLKELRGASAKTISYRLNVQMVLDVNEEREQIKTESSGQIDTAFLNGSAANQTN